MVDYDEDTLIEDSIELLRKHEPASGYYGCFSGGKDSVVLREIARIAGVEVEWHYNHTTIDPPELVRFIRAYHPDVIWNKPKHGNFFRRLERKCHVPTRRVRWCCDEYKETRPPKGVTMLMGIRAEESPARAKNWGEAGTHKRARRKVVLPILQWDSEFLWDFIRSRNLPMCELYAEGFKRLGCVGCPLASRSNRLKEFERWPGFERQWKRSIKKVWDTRRGTLQKDGREWFGSALFDTSEEFWEWWRLGETLPKPRMAEDEPTMDPYA